MTREQQELARAVEHLLTKPWEQGGFALTHRTAHKIGIMVANRYHHVKEVPTDPATLILAAGGPSLREEIDALQNTQG